MRILPCGCIRNDGGPKVRREGCVASEYLTEQTYITNFKCSPTFCWSPTRLMDSKTNSIATELPSPQQNLPTNTSLKENCWSNWLNSNVQPRHISFHAYGASVVTCLQFDADKIISGSDDSTIEIHETSSGRLLHTLRGHGGGIWALEYLGNVLASGSTDKTVRVWGY
jgi:WD40 repeat protein